MSYELVIGTKNWSSWSLRAWLALRVNDIHFDEKLIPLRLSNSADLIKDCSPSQRVPILRVAESGRDYLVFDSLAICETIAERHPDARLWPQDHETRALARSYSAEMHSGFLAFREALSMDFARKLLAPKIDTEVQDQIARIQSSWEYALSRYKSDGNFLFGEFSIADCMYAPVVSRFLTYDIPMSDMVYEYALEIMRLSAMQEWRIGAQQEIDDGLPDQWAVDMVRNAR